MKLYYHIISFLLLSLSAFTAIAQCNQSNDFLEAHYDSTQADFSKVYYTPNSDDFKMARNLMSRFKGYDFSEIWTDNNGQDGIWGLNYWRFQVIVLSAEKDKNNSFVYNVSGKTKLRDTVIDFTGTIKVLAIYMNTSDPTEIDSNTHGDIWAEYYFQQNKNCYNSGVLKGTSSSSFYVDNSKHLLAHDTIDFGDDGYADDTFVGTWTKYKTSTPIKCIFGLGRLPYTFDFDVGDGAMAPNVRYLKNGWQGYEDEDTDDSIPPKWWIVK